MIANLLPITSTVARTVPRRARFRRGQSLVEFAIVALCLTLLISAVLTFGHLLYAAQSLQATATLASRELALVPLPPEISFKDALKNARVRASVFDPHYLVLDVDTFGGRASLQALMNDLPPVNQQLVSVMIYDEIQGNRVLRYPGAVYLDSDPSDDPVDPPGTGYLIAVPLVVARDAEGAETVTWVDVVEEMTTSSGVSPFALSSPQRGLVALRINYPFQAAAMSGFRTSSADPFAPNAGQPLIANDAAVQVQQSPPGDIVASDREFGPYSGPHGLGRQAAFAQEVRPFSRLISAQAVTRREVFDSP